MTDIRLVSFRTRDGVRAGAVIAERVHDLAALTDHAGDASMRGFLSDWAAGSERLRSAVRRGPQGAGLPLAEATLLAPVAEPRAIYCAGANYMDHAAEMNAKQGRPPDPDPHDLGLKPWHFIKASHAVTDPGASIRLPRASHAVDWEAELACVIGRTAKDVPAARALDHVAGYLCANDLSARDLGTREALPAANPFRMDWLAHKSFDGSCPLGPWIVPAEDIADPQALGIKLWVNDVLKQDSNTGKMIFTLAEQIEQLSSRITLHPGDVILTGTPAGVGAGRGEFLKPGDVVKVWIEKIGTLTNTMV
jgi:2-keto-4-pentenoate hydratase/2-oxohepta-3-ene-1,7-dioic acid hydratase in catechol pathway